LGNAQGFGEAKYKGLKARSIGGHHMERAFSPW